MFEIDSVGPIARISFARDKARNAIPIDQWSSLREAIDGVVASGARALILRSAVKGIFCAGADVGALSTLQQEPAGRTHFRRVMHDAIETLAAAPLATIASINGGCYGAAVAIALACDVRIAGNKAEFGITPAKIGILYPASDVARLKALIGNGQAARLLYSAMTIDAREASAIGLVEEMSRDADASAMLLAERIAQNAPASIRGLKQILAGADDADAMFDDAFGGTDFAEGAAAFRERRKPVFP